MSSSSSNSLGVVVEPLLGLGDEDVNCPIASGHRDSLPPAVPAPGTFFRLTVVLHLAHRPNAGGLPVTELLPLTPDELLTTTRAVRKRLDLARPVERDIIEECIAIALQAPSGSNRQAWQWVPVDDPQTKSRLADLYREVFDSYQPRSAGYVEGDTRAERRAAVTASSVHLRDHLHEVPVLLVVYQEGRIEELPLGSHPGFWGSVVPAIWSFMLALRARGLGSTWTTMTCRRSRRWPSCSASPMTSTPRSACSPSPTRSAPTSSPPPRLDPSSVIHWNSW